MRVSGKTIAVTGGGNGIGRELVLQLLDRGARVAALDISAEALQETVRLAGSRAERLSTHVVNVTDRAAIEALPDAIIAAHGQIDGIINCAGIIQPFVKLNDLDYGAIERVMNVNFWGVMYMTKTFLPHLLKRPAAHIVNVSSMGGFLPVPGQTVYGASKAAVKLLTEGLHSELTATTVSVTVVFPGAIATDISKHSGVEAPASAEAKAPKIKTTSPQEAARTILDGMENDAYRVLIGSDAKMMDRLYRLMPERAAAIIYKQMRSLLG
ncbi:SDR family oxidoreductase [Coriobacteriia bacterium Es71-Z0120]|uniref:SDR family NAD(P)-dependent oxidoreductase n=1 Tax=Parvivirga hydrogeniphila TaxID=2939460 RepID=UPI002260F54D|nr:SDR family oxidoreductase [Parvivirga hydrogeniphila]MCL4078051.1 SDR family oxidoreductase [Parvivirga hydrogeniphila]